MRSAKNSQEELARRGPEKRLEGRFAKKVMPASPGGSEKFCIRCFFICLAFQRFRFSISSFYLLSKTLAFGIRLPKKGKQREQPERSFTIHRAHDSWSKTSARISDDYNCGKIHASTDAIIATVTNRSKVVAMTSMLTGMEVP